MAYTFSARRPEYEHCWAECDVSDEHRAEVSKVARMIIANRPHYDPISLATGVPWFVVGIIHSLECSKFPAMTQHLHNGDSLKGPTRQVPAGRPQKEGGPFTFQESAIDALTMKGKEFDKITDWSIPRIAYVLETYNGFGYVPRHINSPYLWSYTDQYRSGKYIADRVWSQSAVSKQCGGMAVLKVLMELDPVGVGLEPKPEPAKAFPKAELPPAALVSTAATSGTVKAALGSALTAVLAMFEWLWGILPDIQTSTDSVLAPLASLAATLKINIGGIAPMVVLASAIIIIVRHVRDKQALDTLQGKGK